MKKLAWIAAPLLLLVLAAIAILPLAARYYAEAWLRDQGVEEASIGDIDFNPFTGVLRIESLAANGANGELAEIGLAELNLEWMQLPGRRIQLADVAVSAGRLDIERSADRAVAVGGLRLPLENAELDGAVPSAADESVWGVGFRTAQIDDISVRYRDEALESTLTLEHIGLDRFATWAPTDRSRLTADLRLDGARLELEITGAPLAAEPRIAATVAVEKLQMAKYLALFDVPDVSEVAGVLSLDLDATIDGRQDRSLFASGEFAVELEQVTGTLEPASLEADSFAWKGDISASVTSDSARPAVSGSSALRIGGLRISHREKPIRLLTLNEFRLEDAEILESGEMQIGRVGLDALELLRYEQETEPALTISKASFRDIGISAEAVVDIEKVIIDSAVVRAHREKNGSFRLVTETVDDIGTMTRAAAIEPEPDQTDGLDEQPTDGTATLFRIGELDIRGPSRIAFTDETVVPAFSGQYTLNSFRLIEMGNIDDARPAQISFDIEQDDSARITGEGDLLLFADERAAELRLDVKKFDLTQISPYVPVYHIQRGRLSLDSKANVKGNQLQVSNLVEVEKLKLSGKAAGEKDMLGEGMAMPLDTALDLLRDSDDRIRLELPISGSLTDPEFGTADVLRVAMQNAMQKAAISYAKNALQPLGTIMFVAKLAGQASRPRFKPLAFGAGDDDLSGEATAYLDKIAGLMRDRPALTITFCGVSSIEDLQYMRAQVVSPTAETIEAGAEAPEGSDVAPVTALPTFDAERIQLAQSRGNAVHDYLTGKHAIDAERLFRCRPEVEEQDGDGPRVEITL